MDANPFDSFGPAMAGVAILGYAVFLLPIALLALGLPYLALRLRPVPAEEQDPQIGLKCALYFIYSLGILMFLTGLNVLVVDLIQRGHWFVDTLDLLGKYDRVHKNAHALMLSGFVFYFLHLILIVGYTNNSKHPATGKVWVGWRLAFHSLIVLFATTALIFQVINEASEKAMEPLLGTLMVWGPSWLIHLALLKARKKPENKTLRKPRDENEDEDRPVRPIRPAPRRPMDDD